MKNSQAIFSSGKKQDYVFRTICEATDVEDWRRDQEEIGFLLQKKIEGVNSWQEISARPPTIKHLWKIWDSLEVQQAMFFRK